MSKNISLALVEAQKNMTKATKQATNPHLRSKYADLGSVMDACLPALNEAGIAVIQPAGEDEHGRYVETTLIHGETGEALSCRVPLIVQKNDMQGYGSAVTYARRYGLMTMAGIAPEDDDGNAASKAPPRQQERKPEPKPQKPDAATVRDNIKGHLTKQETQDEIMSAYENGKVQADLVQLPQPMQLEIKALRDELFDKAAQ